MDQPDAAPIAAPTPTPSRKIAMNPPTVPAPIRGYYSNCVRAGSLLFISGQIGTDANGRLVGENDVAAQANQVLRNIELLVKANGGSMADIVKVTVYVTNMDYLDVIAPVRLKYFPKDGPASAIVEVSRLALPNVKVEIEAIAALE
jgi:2-iminobutanoate/2-iminopropanoate deaminase